MKERIVSGALTLLLMLSAGAVSKEVLTCRSDSSTSVTVNGVTERSGWLGLSVYPVSDKVKPYHTVVYVRQGSWQERLALSGSFQGAHYEVALWDQKVPRASCKTVGCKWCPVNGFHMDGLRSYSSGTVAR